MERPHRSVRPPGMLGDYVTVKKPVIRIGFGDDGSQFTEDKCKIFIKEENHPSDSTKLSEVRPYKCIKCKARFKSRVGLSRHAVRHSGKPFTCPDCGKGLSSQTSLNEHSNIHTNARPHRCEECGKESRQLSVHLRHLITHQANPEKTYDCTVCDKRFKQLENLRQHLRMHTGERPFSCEVCGKSFSRRSDLNSHKKRHSSVRPHVCPECSAGFKNRQNLTRHIRIHFRLKTQKIVLGRQDGNANHWLCHTCKAVFTNLKHFEAHQKMHLEGSEHLDVKQSSEEALIIISEGDDKAKIPTVKFFPKEKVKPASVPSIATSIEKHCLSDHYLIVNPDLAEYRTWLSASASLFQQLQPPYGFKVCKHLHHLTSSLQFCLIHGPGSGHEVPSAGDSSSNIIFCKNNSQYSFIFEQYSILINILQSHFKYSS